MMGMLGFSVRVFFVSILKKAAVDIICQVSASLMFP